MSFIGIITRPGHASPSRQQPQATTTSHNQILFYSINSWWKHSIYWELAEMFFIELHSIIIIDDSQTEFSTDIASDMIQRRRRRGSQDTCLGVNYSKTRIMSKFSSQKMTARYKWLKVTLINFCQLSWRIKIFYTHQLQETRNHVKNTKCVSIFALYL